VGQCLWKGKFSNIILNRIKNKKLVEDNYDLTNLAVARRRDRGFSLALGSIAQF